MMQMRFNATGAERKRLVTAIATTTGAQAVYKGAPSFAYEVGCFVIDKAGTVTVGGAADRKAIESLKENLREQGFWEETEPIGLCIELPRAHVSDTALETLRKLVHSKAQLLKSAFGTDTLEIDVLDDRVRFPWFSQTTDPDAVQIYTHFVTALCAMANTLQRVNAVDRSVANEKYAFRCFLLRLGYIGGGYKPHRKVLLSRLSGNTAFKDKQAGGDGDE